MGLCVVVFLVNIIWGGVVLTQGNVILRRDILDLSHETVQVDAGLFQIMPTQMDLR